MRRICPRCGHHWAWMLSDGRFKCRKCRSPYTFHSVWQSTRLSERTKLRLLDYFVRGGVPCAQQFAQILNRFTNGVRVSARLVVINEAPRLHSIFDGTSVGLKIKPGGICSCCVEKKALAQTLVFQRVLQQNFDERFFALLFKVFTGTIKRSGSSARCRAAPAGLSPATFLIGAFRLAGPDQRSCDAVLAKLAHLAHRAGAIGFE